VGRATHNPSLHNASLVRAPRPAPALPSPSGRGDGLEPGKDERIPRRPHLPAERQQLPRTAKAHTAWLGVTAQAPVPGLRCADPRRPRRGDPCGQVACSPARRGHRWLRRELPV